MSQNNGHDRSNPTQFANVIQFFYNSHQEISIEYFDGHINHKLSGIITSVDLVLGRIKCSHPDGVDWIPIEDILRIEE